MYAGLFAFQPDRPSICAALFCCPLVNAADHQANNFGTYAFVV